MTDGVHAGNAGSEAASDRGWLPGHPEDASDPRLSEAVEITRGVRPQGDEPARKDPGSGRQGVTPVKDGKTYGTVDSYDA
jgi:hypothetical protein